MLATIATQVRDDRATELGAAMADPAAGLQIFTEGATWAFTAAAGLMVLASLVIWGLLNVPHEELATDGPEGVPVH